MSAGDVELIEKLHQQIIELDNIIDDLYPAELAAAAQQAQRCVNSLAEIQRRLAVRVRRSDVWALDGFRSPARWIAFHSGCTVATARRVHGQATAMQHLAHASAAALQGDLQHEHVREIVRCQRRSPDRYDRDIDETFTAAATSGDLDQFAALVRAWHEQADAHDTPDPSELPIDAERESLRLSQGFDGWWTGDIRLSPANGALLNSALERGVGRYLHARREGDTSTEPLDLPALRAQALMDLLDLAGRHHPTKASAPDRYHITLVLNIDEHGHVRPVDPQPPGATCDATLHRLVLGADSQPLDIGRAARDWPAPLRAAIITRDQRCRWTGCDEPPGHCDIHHCTPWEHGGPTSITNGILLCRWHHTFLHSKRWTVQLDTTTQTPTFHRPDGTTLTPPARPHPRPHRARPPGDPPPG